LRRTRAAAAAAPNRTIIGGAGTGVPLVDDQPEEPEDEPDEEELDEDELLLLELVEVLMLPELEPLVEIPLLPDDEELLPDEPLLDPEEPFDPPQLDEPWPGLPDEPPELEPLEEEELDEDDEEDDEELLDEELETLPEVEVDVLE
jgi:hypothetical protein